MRFVSHHPFRSIRDEWTTFHVRTYLRKYAVVDSEYIDKVEYPMLKRVSSSDVYELCYYDENVWIGIEMRSRPRQGVFRVLSYIIIWY
jgi:hypothetical protein